MSTQPAVRRLEPDEWELVRAARVAALTDAPEAFGSTLARELTLTEDEWRDRLARGVWFAAVRGDEVVALACGVPGVNDASRQLTGMWVSLPERGSGLAVELVGHVLDWARADGANAVQLWVVASNTRAISLYEKSGFTRTGRTKPLPRDPRVLEIDMLADLSHTSPREQEQ